MAPRARSAAQRAVRSLVQLEASASTSRTLNLISVWRRFRDAADYLERPFFANPVLNRSIIVKHRLRANERDVIASNRSIVTKVILPIDFTDLRAGARTLIVGQIGYDGLLAEVAIGDAVADERDKALLDLLDTLPSLDPFFLGVGFSKAGFKPARCYFDLSDADAERMFAFVRNELNPLINMSFGDVDVRSRDKASKFANKIMANAADEELEPLRVGLSMSKADFVEGIFCWKGFIYYKWCLNDLLPQVRPVATEIANVRAFDAGTDADRAYIDSAREKLAVAIGRACETVRVTLKIYDEAYRDLTDNGQPMAFKDFLIKAPAMFQELGERLGAIQHIVSFWRFRFPIGVRPKPSFDELYDILSDFESSLGFESERMSAASATWG